MKFCGEVRHGSGRNRLDLGAIRVGYFSGSWIIFQHSLASYELISMTFLDRWDVARNQSVRFRWRSDNRLPYFAPILPLLHDVDLVFVRFSAARWQHHNAGQ